MLVNLFGLIPQSWYFTPMKLYKWSLDIISDYSFKSLPIGGRRLCFWFWILLCFLHHCLWGRDCLQHNLYKVPETYFRFKQKCLNCVFYTRSPGFPSLYTTAQTCTWKFPKVREDVCHIRKVSKKLRIPNEIFQVGL